MTSKKIRQELFSMQDPVYRDFQKGFCSAIHKNRAGAICSDTTQLFVFCLYPNY